MKSVGRPFIFWCCLSFAGNATAQLVTPEVASERDVRPPASLSTLRGDEAATRGDDVVQSKPGSSSLCEAVASAAATNGLPFEFFARVIWQESRFKSDAIGPLTPGGQRAQGIAQFMPSTAAERLLRDPCDPDQALPKAAEFLRDLRAQFGNFGLAAAAYNAGPQRVHDWLAGKRTLPSETQTYIRMVTGRSAQEWARPDQEALTITLPREMSCAETATLFARPQTPPAFAQAKQTPEWVVQLVGDRSEIKALATYRQLQIKHEALLGTHEPDIVRTTVGAAPIWTRVRIDASSRQTAETLCRGLRAAGENCLVQRN
jgi:hypothetical protein